jgi:N-acyl homoserine lactone hydrolase
MLMKPISRVSVVSTGAVQIRPQHRDSTGSPLFWWLLTSRRWTAPLPIYVYVIEHERGLVLFDTGLDRGSVTDPGYYQTEFVRRLYTRIAHFVMGPEQTLTEQLRGIGYEPGQVHTVVLSHLHQDHVGGLAEVSAAEIVVDAREWAQLDSAFLATKGLLRSHIELPGLRWTRVTPAPVDDPSIAPFTAAHDLFGDGSLLLLRTPGHTAGSLSMLLRQDGMPPMLFVGDLCYSTELLEQGRVPGVGARRVLRESSRAVRELSRRNPGLLVMAAHDPQAALRLRNALGALTRTQARA